MKPPRKLSVLGMNVEVVMDDSDVFQDHYFGMFELRNMRIRISNDPKVSDDQVRETLLHEVIHAVCCAMAVELDESEVSALSRGLYAVIRDNPKFGAFLVDE